MKKTLCAIVCAISFNACGKDDSNGNNDNQSRPETPRGPFLSSTSVPEGIINISHEKMLKELVESNEIYAYQKAKDEDNRANTTEVTSDCPIKDNKDAAWSIEGQIAKIRFAEDLTNELEKCNSGEEKAKLKARKLTVKAFADLVCSESDLTHQSNKLNSLFDNPIMGLNSSKTNLETLCAKGYELVYNMEVDVDASMEGPIDFDLNQTFEFGMSKEDGTPCKAVHANGQGQLNDCISWQVSKHRDSSNILEWVKIGYDAKDDPGTVEFKRFKKKALTWTIGSEALWYESGEIDFEFQNWRGVIQYKEANEPPTYTATNGFDIQSGILKKPN